MTSTRRQFLQSTAALGLGSLCSSAAPVRSERPQDLAALPQSLPQGAFRRLGSNRFLSSENPETILLSDDDRHLMTLTRSYTELWDVETGERLNKWHDSTLSGAGERFMDGLAGVLFFRLEGSEQTTGYCSLCRYDLETKVETNLWNIRTRGANTSRIAYNLHSKTIYLFTTGELSMVEAYSTLNGDRIWRREAPWEHPVEIEISADDSRLIFHSEDTIQVLDTRNGAIVRTIKTQTKDGDLIAEIRSVSPDGGTLLVHDTSVNETIALNTKTGKRQWKIKDRPAVKFLPDGKSVLLLSESESGLLDSMTGKLIRKYEFPGVDFGTVSNSGRFIAMTSKYGRSIKIFDLETGRFRPQSADPVEPLEELHMPDNRTVAAFLRDNSRGNSNSRIWSVTGHEYRNYTSNAGPAEQYLEHISPDRSKRAYINNYFAGQPCGHVDLRVKFNENDKSTSAFMLGTGSDCHDEFTQGFRPVWIDSCNIVTITRKRIIHIDLTIGRMYSHPYQLIDKAQAIVNQVHVDSTKSFATFVLCHNANDTHTYALIFDLKSKSITQRTYTQDYYVRNCLKSFNNIMVISSDTRRRNQPKDLLVEVFDMDWQRINHYHFDLSSPEIRDPKLSPDGFSLLINMEARQHLEEYHCQSWHLLESLTGKIRARGVTTSTITHAAFSPNGRTIATAHPDAPIFLWDLYGERTSPQPEPSARSLPKLWGDLESYDAELAFNAIRTFVQHPSIALKFLGERLLDIRKFTREEVARDIESLGHAEYRTREASQKRLTASVDALLPILLESQKRSDLNFEVQCRIESILKASEGISASSIRIHRCIEILGHIRTADTKALLVKLSTGTGLLSREATRLVKSWE